MALRFPSFLVFLFVLQALLAFQIGRVPAPMALFHLLILLTTLVYFGIAVWGMPRLTRYGGIRFDRLFSHSLLPFLQVAAADMWLMATSVHVFNPVATVGLMMVLASLFLL
ncbi:MAG TPA: hypothetical protein V6D22_19785 [Candidatus Obscuribacterales bacterium]